MGFLTIQSRPSTLHSKMLRAVDLKDMNWILNKPKFSSDELNSSLSTSPWSGHRNFAYDLIGYMKPKRIVELGTHYGCSFFAFLQACKDFGLSTETIAIDTWVGEEHAGFYSEEVFELVNKTIDAYYSGQNARLLRKRFDEALQDVEDESVDILHIDGFHSYEAVSHDYESWLSRVASDGIVLFHDVSPSCGYGSADFWSEIKASHPHFEFLDHSFGLGILFPKGDGAYNPISRYLNGDLLRIYQLQADLELRDRQYKDAQQQLEERWAIMESMDSMIRDRDEIIKKQAHILEKQARRRRRNG
jgi:predicted O-methyltransferase YrrM